jgi:DNA-directed RNA polymerase sigma subunit (sigma70/sigma32)|tara:strand:- start:3722 stop:4180 length:459 start_codon:yes stop_codon:yes gene_type:complete
MRAKREKLQRDPLIRMKKLDRRLQPMKIATIDYISQKSKLSGTEEDVLIHKLDMKDSDDRFEEAIKADATESFWEVLELNLKRNEMFIVEQRILHGRTFEEIGADCGFSRQRAHKIWMIAKEKLKPLLIAWSAGQPVHYQLNLHLRKHRNRN